MITDFIVKTFGQATDIVKYVITLVISILPVVELRGAIPVGMLAFKLPWYGCLIVSVIGNMLPVPLILLFVKKLIEWMKNSKRLNKAGLWLESKAEKNTPKIQKYEFFGLMLFVAIPLPMTGAWTGALVAALTGMKFKNAILSILGGVIIAGIIVTLICGGVLGFLRFMLG